MVPWHIWVLSQQRSNHHHFSYKIIHFDLTHYVDGWIVNHGKLELIIDDDDDDDNDDDNDGRIGKI